jgi:hypothetical protein
MYTVKYINFKYIMTIKLIVLSLKRAEWLIVAL